MKRRQYNNPNTLTQEDERYIHSHIQVHTWSTINALSHLSSGQIPYFDETIQPTRCCNYTKEEKKKISTCKINITTKCNGLFMNTVHYMYTYFRRELSLHQTCKLCLHYIYMYMYITLIGWILHLCDAHWLEERCRDMIKSSY